MGGTRVGLYLSKQIIKKHGASIDVKSYEHKTKFTICFKEENSNNSL